MSPNFLTTGSVRSAAALNEQIRAIWIRSGGSLSAEERAEYELLVAEWAAAVRDEAIAAV